MLSFKLNKKAAFDLLKSEEYVISKAFVIAVLEYIQSRAKIKIAFNDEVKLKIRNAFRSMKCSWNKVRYKRIKRRHFLEECEKTYFLLNITSDYLDMNEDDMDFNENSDDSFCYKFKQNLCILNNVKIG